MLRAYPVLPSTTHHEAAEWLQRGHPILPGLIGALYAATCALDELPAAGIPFNSVATFAVVLKLIAVRTPYIGSWLFIC